MTALDAALVRRRLARIARNLDDLATIDGLPLDAYVADRFRRKGTERLLQETVEAAVDINLHVTRAEGAPATGLRNRIVHEYDAIDDGIVLEAVSDAVREAYLARRGL